MALPVVELNYGFPTLDPFNYYYDALDFGTFQSATSTRLVLSDENGIRIVFKGEFDLSAGMVTAGSVEKLKVFAGNDKVMSESNLDISATALIDAINQWQSFNSEPLQDLLLDIPARFVGSEESDFVVAFGVGSKLIGRQGDDELVAVSGDSMLKGGKGNDLLVAEAGNSWYVGGKGDDVFAFVTLTAPNKIKDFTPGDDLIQLNPFAFEGVGPGFLDDSQFKQGTSASTEAEIVLYQKSKGNIWYDQDGSGSTYDPVKFAKVDKGTNLAADDFYGEFSGMILA